MPCQVLEKQVRKYTHGPFSRGAYILLGKPISVRVKGAHFLFLRCDDCSAKWENSSIPVYVKETLSPRDFLANNCPWFYWIIVCVQINV